MNEVSLFSAFLIGIAGSVHCIGMCGGIVGVLTFSAPKHRAQFPYHIAYNLGRICSYAFAGAFAGSLGAIISHQFAQGLNWLQLLSAIFLVLMGLYIGDWWKGLSMLEKQGQHIWRLIQPYSKKLLPLKTPVHALPFGMLWGWLPCGLVYSTLTWSLAAGSWYQGALIMLCFGLGTLPMLLALASLGNQFKNTFTANWVRKSISIALIIAGFILIYLSVDRIV